MEINTILLLYLYIYIYNFIYIYINIYKAGFSVNTKLYKTTIESGLFSPLFILKVALKRIKSAQTPL